MKLAISLLALTLSTPLAHAQMDVSFREGAPKDRFEFRNRGDCALRNAVVTLDLSGSAGGLVFDVTDAGAGVEVFQPFDVVAGRDALAALPQVRDGDNKLALQIGTLQAGQTVAFTIDVDDTKRAREITVSDSEIGGGAVRLEAGSFKSEARFDGAPRTSLATPAC